MAEIVFSQLLESKNLHEELLDLAPDIEEIVKETRACFKRGGKILVFGCGGSASDAQHFAAEILDKPVIALTTNTSTITAIGNDFGFAYIFYKQLRALGKKGDLAIGISTSGNSKSVFLTISEAKQLKMKTIVLTGKTGGLLDDYADITLKVPSENTARIQEAHILILHILASLINDGQEKKKVKYKYGPETEV